MHLAAALWAAVWAWCCVPAEVGPLRVPVQACGEAGGIVLFLLLWGIMAAAVETVHRVSRGPAPWPRGGELLLCAEALALFLLLWWVKGTRCSADFLGSLDQARSGAYNTIQPLSYTLFIGALDRLGPNSVANMAAQTGLFVTAAGVAGHWCRREGLPLLCGAGVVALLLPLCQWALAVLVKDALYTCCFVIMTVGLCSLYRRDDGFSRTTLYGGLAGLVLLRPDALLIAAVAGIGVLTVARRRRRGGLAAAGGVSGVLFLGVAAHVLLPLAVGARNDACGTRLAMPAEMLCEVVVHDADLPPRDRERICRLIMPEPVMRRHHDSAPEWIGERYLWRGFESEADLRRHSFVFRLAGRDREVLALCAELLPAHARAGLRPLVAHTRLLRDPSYTPSLALGVLLFLAGLLLLRRLPLRAFLPFFPLLANIFIVTCVATTYEYRYALPLCAAAPLLLCYAGALFMTPEAGDGQNRRREGYR